MLNSVFSSFQARCDLKSLCAGSGGGIGLALCRMIAEKHGGTFESKAEDGSFVCRLLLPAAGTPEAYGAQP